MFTSTDPSQADPSPKLSGSRQARQQQFRDATRRAILDAALELFVADGYASVSIRNIAARVEYSPAAIYKYFSSKDEIFFALAEEGFRLLGHHELSSETASDPLDDVRAMLWRLYSFSKEQPQYFALVFLDRNVPRISKEYEGFAFLSQMLDKTVARIQRCVDEGALPQGLDIHAAKRLLFAPILGFAAMRLSNRLAPFEDPDALVRQSIDVTLAGLGKVGPRGNPRSGDSVDSPCHSERSS